MRNVPFLVDSPSDVAHLVLDHSDYAEMDLDKTVLLFSLNVDNADVLAISGTQADSPNDLLEQLFSNNLLEGHDVVIVAPDSWSQKPYFIDVLSSLKGHESVLDVMSINVGTRQGYSFLCSHDDGEQCNTRHPVAPCTCEG